MGMSYEQHRMVGVYVGGQIPNFYDFLSTHGYHHTEQEKSELEESGEWSYCVLAKFNLEGIQVINLDAWSGHDFFVGYDLGLKAEDSATTQKLVKKFLKNFPNTSPAFSSFTSVD